MKKQQYNIQHTTYAYLVVFCLFVLGVLFVFYLLPNLPDVMESTAQSAIPHADIKSIAQFM